MCSKHYKRALVTGDPNRVKRTFRGIPVDDLTPRPCRVCGEVKPGDEFYSRGTTRRTECITCVRKRAHEWKRSNYELEVFQLHRREAAYIRKYGITVADYNAILESQNNRCAICGRNASSQKKPLDVDHCHDSGVVRGLLCTRCNTTLGHIDRVGTAAFDDYLSSLPRYILGG